MYCGGELAADEYGEHSAICLMTSHTQLLLLEEALTHAVGAGDRLTDLSIGRGPTLPPH